MWHYRNHSLYYRTVVTVTLWKLCVCYRTVVTDTLQRSIMGLFVIDTLHDFSVCYNTLVNCHITWFFSVCYRTVVIGTLQSYVCYRIVCHCHITGLFVTVVLHHFLFVIGPFITSMLWDSSSYLSYRINYKLQYRFVCHCYIILAPWFSSSKQIKLKGVLHLSECVHYCEVI